jgi:hypothetical protein
VPSLAASMAWAELRAREKGLRGPSGVWLAIWVISVSYRQLRKWTEPEPVVVRERLLPGEQLVVSHFRKGTEPPEPSKRRRSKRRRHR